MNTFHLQSKFPKFFEQLKDDNFEFVSFKTIHHGCSDVEYEVTIVDSYGIKYQGYISEANYEFDIDMFLVI